MSEIKTDSPKICSSTIKLIGVGNAGCKVLRNMIQTNFEGVDFILVNSNFRYKRSNKATYISIDNLENKNTKNIFNESDVVIIVAAMGGNIATKYATEVAKKAKERGALTIAVVTKPFCYDGIVRSEVAEIGILKLLKKVDTLFIERNNTITSSITCTGDINAHFEFSEVLLETTLHDLVEIFKPSALMTALITIDIEDIKNIMTDAGIAWISKGIGSKYSCVNDAVSQALSNVMFNIPIYYDDTRNIIFQIIGGDNFKLYEVNKIVEDLRQSFPKDANIFISVLKDTYMEDKIAITLIGAG